MSTKQDEIRNTVQSKYGEFAIKGQPCCGCRNSKQPGSSSADTFAQKLGYTAAELADLPEGANMALSCGNPSAIALLKEGETVVDLGSGGGFDAFIAAQKVGRSGHVIGVDMTPAMINKARANTSKFQKRTGLDNVEFRLGEIEHLPLADESVDVVISNCVINLSPEKEQVWREIARVLKPGGRVCISDIALLQPLPTDLRDSVNALVGCLAGATLIEDTVSMVNDTGLVITSAKKESAFAEEMEKSRDPLHQKIMELVPKGTNLRDYATSLHLVATKQ